MEGDQRIVLDVEEVFALQLAVLHSATGIYRGRLNLDIQNPTGDISGWKRERGVPLVEFTDYSDRGLHIERDRALLRRDYENRSLSPSERCQQGGRYEAEDCRSHAEV